MSDGATLSVTAFGAVATYRINGSAENDSNLNIVGGNGADTLLGGRRGDIIKGGGGGDVLLGDRGADGLHGDAGADTFAYRSTRETKQFGADVIYDLESGDTIELSAIDANTTVDGNQAFVLVQAFTGAGGEATLSGDDAYGYLLMDTDGDARVEGRMTMLGDVTGFEGWVW